MTPFFRVNKKKMKNQMYVLLHVDYSQFFGCDVGKFSFRYLGLPMHYRKLSNSDWKTIEQRIEKKLSSWKAKMLTVGGGLVLNNSGFVELTYVHVVFL